MAQSRNLIGSTDHPKCQTNHSFVNVMSTRPPNPALRQNTPLQLNGFKAGAVGATQWWQSIPRLFKTTTTKFPSLDCKSKRQSECRKSKHGLCTPMAGLISRSSTAIPPRTIPTYHSASIRRMRSSSRRSSADTRASIRRRR